MCDTYYSESISNIPNNSVPKSFLSTCLVCNSFHKTSLSTNPHLLDTNTKVFESCSKYLNVGTQKIKESLRWDFTQEPLPYCASCFLSAHKIFALDEQIQTLRLEIDCIIQEFTAAIIKSHESDIKNNSEATGINGNSLQKKISHYRNLVANDVRKSPTAFQDIPSVIGSENEIEIKLEPLYDCTEDFDNLSPLGSYLDDLQPEFQGIDEHKDCDLKVTHSKKRKQTTPIHAATCSIRCEKREKLNQEDFPESIKRIIKTYGMHTRTLVLKLHKIHKDKFGKWSVTEGTQKRQPTRRGKRRIAKYNKSTKMADDGKRICAGVLMKPTADGRQQCGECGKIYRNRITLSRHIKNFHAGIKQKRYYQPKYTTKFFKLITTPDGKFYAGVKLKELSGGRVQCGSCDRICSSNQAVRTHIRWYHLGKEVAQVYKKRREAYQIKRNVVLGKSVPETKLLKAEEMLKNKVFLKGVISPTDIEDVQNLPEKAVINSNRIKSKRTFKANVSKSEPTTEKVKREEIDSFSSKVVWKEDATDSEDVDDPVLDDPSNDPDFCPDERINSPDQNDPESEEHGISDSGSCASLEDTDDRDTDDSENENAKDVNTIRYELVTQEDGRQLYGGVQIITVENKLQCGECSAIETDIMEMQKHIENAHLEAKNETRTRHPNSSKRERPRLIVKDGRKYFGGIEIKEHYRQNGKKVCGKCKKVFQHKCSILRHIKVKHLGMKENTYFTKRVKVVKSADGKKTYGGIEIETLEDGKWRCGFCNRSLDSLQRIRRHIRECHLNENQKDALKIVERGGKRFFGGIELIFKEGGKEECGQCKTTFENGTALQRHIKSRHLGMRLKSYHVRPQEDLFFKMIDTEDGNKTYAGVTVLTSEDGRYTCGPCRKSFDTKEHLKRHIRSTHRVHSDIVIQARDAQPDKPRKNERTYFNSDGLLYNGISCTKLKDGTYQCGFDRGTSPKCGKTFLTSFNMVAHLRNNHIKKKTIKPVIGSRYVNRTVTTEDGRKIHAGVEMVKMDNGDLQCGECQKIFKPKQISSLMGHIIRIHEQKEGGHFVCPICGRNCGYKFNLAKHMLKHKESKTFVCDVCGLSYKQLSSLTHHQRQVHMGIKRHTCDQCGKQYYHTRDFIIHQRRHTGEKPFQCCVCGKNFYSEYEMKVHEKIHNNEGQTPASQSRPSKTTKKKSVECSKKKRANDFECDYCDNSFRTLAAAKKHMLAEHPDSDEADQEGKIPTEKEDYVPNTYLVQPNASSSKHPNAYSMPQLENMSSMSPFNPFNKIPPTAHLPTPPTLLPMYDYAGTPALQLYGRPPYLSN